MIKGSRSSRPDTTWEASVGYPIECVVGVDEVGRGCLAGPVVAGAVVLPSRFDIEANSWILEIRDSKQIGPEKREMLSRYIKSWARAHAIGLASVEEIDQLNIHRAVHLAMVRAVLALVGMALQPKHVLVDGKFIPKDMGFEATAIVKGDQKSLSIACASIIAKVWRDQHLCELESRFPGFGLAVHKGYPTKVHVAALRRLGVSPIHRRSFGPVREMIAARIVQTPLLYNGTRQAGPAIQIEPGSS